ncbi:MAG: rhodanese-related sulfurtransferase [Buchnera aphidicola (Schlechtendalia peitan)]
MTILYNSISNKELKSRMLSDNTPRITVSFYKYYYIHDPYKFRNDWYVNFKKFNVFGRIYIANEGINAQISIPKDMYSHVKNFIYNYSDELNNVYINHALDTKKSFWMLRIKVRNTLLADHLSKKSYNLDSSRIYLESKEVNNMLNKKDVICLDIRNNYEFKIGHFEKSINIPVNTFKEQLQKIIIVLNNQKNRRFIIYCTGGIRCEKTASWMMYNGFKFVYQIKGGIIGYVNDAKKNNISIKFKGKNFVFDERMSETVSDDILAKCFQCNEYCDTYKNCYNNFCHRLFIQCIQCSKKFKNFCSKNCMIS